MVVQVGKHKPIAIQRNCGFDYWRILCGALCCAQLLTFSLQIDVLDSDFLDGCRIECAVRLKITRLLQDFF